MHIRKLIKLGKSLFSFALLLLLHPSVAHAVVAVPEGNRNAEQPAIPFGSKNRTKRLKTTFDAKYEKVLRLLQNDKSLRGKIGKVAEDYEIDPVHIAGAIIGEHTYNVDVYDRLQTYYVKAISYLSTSLSFEYDGENVETFFNRSEFDSCKDITDSYDLWICRERLWDSEFRGKTIDDTAYPNDRLSAVFFQPYYAGQTFGIGQLNPLTALRMSDMVNEVSGLPKLNVRDANSVYKTIMDPDLTLPYVAATIRVAIDSYREIAGFDISNNPGITATLYNLGDPRGRAEALKSENLKRAESGDEPRLPEENYYGWLVNHRIEDLKALF